MGGILHRIFKRRRKPKRRFPTRFVVIDYKNYPSDKNLIGLDMQKVVLIYYTDGYRILGTSIEDYHAGIEDFYRELGFSVLDLTKNIKQKNIILSRFASRSLTSHPKIYDWG